MPQRPGSRFHEKDTSNRREIIALVPAAGLATRISPLPCSKEIYPLGLGPVGEEEDVRPKVVCHYLLEKMRRAGARKAFIVIRRGKWDIPGYCGDGSFVGMDLAYLIMGAPFGPPYSIDQAFAFVRNARVLFGFPDILFSPEDVFIRLLKKQVATGADIVLALFPAHDHRCMDMVEVESGGRVRNIYLKPPKTHLRLAWICAVWTGVFTNFLHTYVRTNLASMDVLNKSKGVDLSAGELSVGAVFQAALLKHLHIQSVVFSRGSYVDIGTPDGLSDALRKARHFRL